MLLVKNFRNLLIITVFMLAGIVLAFYFRPLPLEQRLSEGEKLGGDFVLNSKQGEVRLTDFRGKVVLFFVGYASCPDICPTALTFAAAALDNLSVSEQKGVVGIFMSVDPERDSLEKLAQYTNYFHSNFIGATSDRENIDIIVKQYGAFYRKVELQSSAMGYAVDHSSNIYLIDKKGSLAKAVPHITEPEIVTNEIRKLLKQEI